MAKAAPAAAKGVVLSDVQIATWARTAGFPEDQIATAVAVALAESSGRIDAVGGPNPLDGSYDYGVWQINERAHPEKFQSMPDWWTASNAQMALAVYRERQNSWAPWTVFKTGAYQLYMGRGKAAAEGKSTGTTSSRYDERWDIPGVPDAAESAVQDTAGALLGIGNALKSIAAAGVKAGAWMGQSENWIRVAQVGIGVVLLGVALNVVIRPIVTSVAGPAVSALTKGKAQAK